MLIPCLRLEQHGACHDLPDSGREGSLHIRNHRRAFPSRQLTRSESDPPIFRTASAMPEEGSGPAVSAPCTGTFYGCTFFPALRCLAQSAGTSGALETAVLLLR